MFNRAIVIGCPGAGKSTFARGLRDKTKLPLYYLDRLFHMPDKSTAPREAFDRAMGEILVREKWILDGNYMRTLPMRLRSCERAFFFDLPVEMCLEGAAARIGTAREDMPWIETEFDPDFRQYILDFPREQLPEIRRLLAVCAPREKVITFSSRQEADDWLDRL